MMALSQCVVCLLTTLLFFLATFSWDKEPILPALLYHFWYLNPGRWGREEKELSEDE